MTLLAGHGIGVAPAKDDAPQDEEARAEGLVARLEAEPARLRSVAALSAAVGMPAAELDGLMVRHFHASAADVIERTAIRAAAARLLAGADVAQVAKDCGFGAVAPFETAFERRMAMPPGAWPGIATGAFRLRLPPDYPTDTILAYLGRDPTSPTELVRGDRYEVALRLPGGAVALAIVFADGVAQCELTAGDLAPTDAATLHARLLGRLGLGLDPGPFEAHVHQLDGLASLVDGRAGLRVPLVADPFDALIWVIAGQQVSLAAAFSMRRRLILATGQPVGDLVAPPSPEAVARLDEDDLGSLGFSRAKSRALREATARIIGGGLDLEALANAPATSIERVLLGLRGIGPWSANYMLMRGYGFADCVPVGDSALGEGLRRFYALSARPDARATVELMAPFRPYRSLATFHLWRISAGGG